jgi:hypothetical protein
LKPKFPSSVVLAIFEPRLPIELKRMAMVLDAPFVPNVTPNGL